MRRWFRGGGGIGGTCELFDTGDMLGSDPRRERDWLLRRDSEVTLAGTLALRDGGPYSSEWDESCDSPRLNRGRAGMCAKDERAGSGELGKSDSGCRYGSTAGAGVVDVPIPTPGASSRAKEGSGGARSSSSIFGWASEGNAGDWGELATTPGTDGRPFCGLLKTGDARGD